MEERIVLRRVDGRKLMRYRCGKIIKRVDFNLENKSLYSINNQIYCKRCFYNPTTRILVKLAGW